MRRLSLDVMMYLPLLLSEQSVKITHIDIGDDYIDTVTSHMIGTYPISICRKTMSIWWMNISIYRIPNRYHVSHIDMHLDIS